MSITINCDLRSKFSAARDQGKRPTCLAFAASDTHTALRGDLEELSVEYIYFHAQSYSGRPVGAGATVPSIIEALREDGQPHEKEWPYSKVEPTLSQWLLPAGITDVYKCLANNAKASTSDVFSYLNSNQTVILLLRLTKSFFKPETDGSIALVSGDLPSDQWRHAVVAAGHGIRGTERFVLIRNSWGAGWGVGGYAWLPENLLGLSLFGIATLKEIANVPASKHAA